MSSETEAWRALTEEGEALAKERRTVDAAAAYNAACIVQVFSQFVCLCLCVSVCVVCVLPSCSNNPCAPGTYL